MLAHSPHLTCAQIALVHTPLCHMGSHTPWHALTPLTRPPPHGHQCPPHCTRAPHLFQLLHVPTTLCRGLPYLAPPKSFWTKLFGIQTNGIRLDAEGIYLHRYQLLEPADAFKGDPMDKEEEISDIQSEDNHMPMVRAMLHYGKCSGSGFKSPSTIYNPSHIEQTPWYLLVSTFSSGLLDNTYVNLLVHGRL